MKTFNNSRIALLKNGRTYSLSAADPRFKAGYKLLTAGADEEFINLLSQSVEKAAVRDTAGFRIDGDSIFYKSFEIVGALKIKLQSLIKDSLSLEPYVLFMEECSQNVSRTAVFELFDFLSYRELPISENGTVLGFKGILNNNYSVRGNLDTVVTKGIVNEKGQILNSIGAEIEVPRNQVGDDRDNECGLPGLYVGSYDYARGHGEKVVMVEFSPKHAVTVPRDSSFQKLRVSAYKVICDYNGEEFTPAVKVNKSFIVPIKAPTKVEDKVRQYIQNKMAAGVEEISVRNIAKSVGEKQALVCDIVLELGYYVNDGGKFDI